MIAVSAAIFYVSSETVLKMENTQNFDYSHPMYMFNVLMAGLSMGTGTFGFIECFRRTKKEKREDEEATEASTEF